MLVTSGSPIVLASGSAGQKLGMTRTPLRTMKDARGDACRGASLELNMTCIED